MKGDAKVVEYLNRGLRSELTAVSQYWLHFRMLNDWGYIDLAKFWRKESIEEMNHADRFVDRPARQWLSARVGRRRLARAAVS